MGWFSKKDEKGSEKIPELPDLPKLPGLPSIPSIPSLPTGNSKTQLPQLPKFPSSPVGEKFSQNAIKEAVGGEEEGDSNDFQDGMMKLPSRNMTSELGEPPKTVHEKVTPQRHSNEPVFIRIDKFEESLKTFDHTKEKVAEMEKLLKDIRRVREQEEHELEQWENEIQNIKERISRVDENIFSKIE